MGSNGMSARELLSRERNVTYRPIPTFVQAFDAMLAGGIKPGVITEVFGESGIGKTTLCCQLCLDVQIPIILQGLDSEALFIDTENSLVVNRIKDMANAFVTHCNSVIPKSCGVKVSEQRILSGFHIVKCPDLAQFEKDETFSERSKPLYAIGQVLHFLVEKHGLAIVVTNNVTTRFDKGNEYFVPFLGDSWSHIPNQRINLSWSNQGRNRVAEIIQSAYNASASVNYRVTASGIRQ